VTALFALAMLSAAPAEVYTYWIEPCSNPGTGCLAGDEALAEWALRAWETASGGAVELRRESSMEKARIRLRWVGARSGLYGEMRAIEVGGRRGAEVFIRPDLSQLGSEIAAAGRADALFRHAVVYLTCLHETGHALGMPHTAAFDDIMYSFQYGGDIPEYFARYRRKLSSREDIRRHSGISPADRARLVELHRPGSSR
jgi:hypothetical protein